MVWWISGAVVGIALLVLILSVGALLRRMRTLRRLGRRLQVSATDAQALMEPIAALQQRAESMQEQLLTMERQLAARRERAAAG